MKRVAGPPFYNERLFSGGLRTFFHLARFRWLKDSLHRLNCPQDSVLELGCFDARSLEWLPVKPKRYLGLDANWEGGLDLGLARLNEKDPHELRLCQSLSDLPDVEEKFDIAICLETLEHLPDSDIEDYLAFLARSTRHYVLVTVPNEKGPLFLVKWLTTLLLGHPYPYTSKELFFAVTGQCSRIPRDEHKGFDYHDLLKKMDSMFKVKAVAGAPFRSWPLWTGLTVTIVACPK